MGSLFTHTVVLVVDQAWLSSPAPGPSGVSGVGVQQTFPPTRTCKAPYKLASHLLLFTTMRGRANFAFEKKKAKTLPHILNFARIHIFENKSAQLCNPP